MPTYEYVCTKCGHRFEAIQSMTEKPLSRCPVCKSAIRRVINGGIGVIFKGSGFYSTDNKKSSALTGGNGGSKDRDKSSEKPKESPSEKSSTEKSSSEKTFTEKSSSEKGSREKTPAS
jgi:putative FmdB family regulatory protein